MSAVAHSFWKEPARAVPTVHYAAGRTRRAWETLPGSPDRSTGRGESCTPAPSCPLLLGCPVARPRSPEAIALWHLSRELLRGTDERASCPALPRAIRHTPSWTR